MIKGSHGRVPPPMLGSPALVPSFSFSSTWTTIFNFLEWSLPSLQASLTQSLLTLRCNPRPRVRPLLRTLIQPLPLVS